MTFKTLWFDYRNVWVRFGDRNPFIRSAATAFTSWWCYENAF